MRTASTSSEFSGTVVERFPQRILNCMIGWSGYDRIRTLLTLRMPLKQMRAVFQKLKHTPLALGSWWGLIVFIPMTLVIVWRFLDEEKFLLRNLA